MNYLFRYLSTLKQDDLSHLPSLDLTPRERQTLDLLTAMRGDSTATKQELIARLGMSGSMFDKTCSTLLRALLDRAVPEGGMKLLAHLAERGVYDLLLHELRRAEKEIRATATKGELARFYRAAFDVLHLRFSSEYPERVARQIAAKYRGLDPSPDTAVYIEARLIAVAVWMEASRRTGEETRLRLEKRLLRNDARITTEIGPLARFRQAKAWIIYYGQLKRDPDRRVEHLRAAAALCDLHPDILTREDKVLILCQLAEEHYFYRTDLATPLRMYRELYESYPDILRGEDYHVFKFIQLCIINGAYDEAAALLDRHFGSAANMVVHGGGRSKDVALLWTKLMVMKGGIEAARAHLDDAILLNQKGFYFQFEVECRMLHTAICFLEGEFDTIERRLPAHIKYLRSKGATFTASRYYPWFFKLVGAFIDERTTGRRLSPRLENKLEEFMEGPAAQYGVLLRKLRSAG